jgi:hypothetical protein
MKLPFVRRPLYTLAEVHQYVQDIETMEKIAKSEELNTDSYNEYQRLISIMREVLERLLENI